MEAVLRNDDMVEHIDAENLPCAYELFGDLDVFLARQWISRRVIMSEDNCCRAILYTRSENLPRMDDVRVDRTDRDDFVMNDAVMTVEIQSAQVFLGQSAHIVEIIVGVLCCANDGKA